MKTSKSIFILSFFIPFSLLFSDIIKVPVDTLTIQGGIFLAETGDTVLVDEGTYYENINFEGKAITVASQFIMDEEDTSHISNTVIDGSQNTDPDSGSVVSFISGEDTTSVLCGFTITGGSGTYNNSYNGIGGGGIYMLAGGKIIHNIITNNHLENTGLTAGGGLVQIAQNNNCNIIIKDNFFNYNSFTSHSIIPSGGGGIYCLWEPSIGGSLQICNNNISYNSGNNTGSYKAIAGGIGLSIYLPKAVNAVVENNLITHNELNCKASIGAGIYVVYWEPGGQITDLVPGPVIRNNIIAHNYSQDRGGGIGIWTVEKGHSSLSQINPQPAIINNTIVNNKANDGCGIFNFDSYPLLMNNIFWDDLSIEGSREIFNDNINYPEYPDKINNGQLYIYNSDIHYNLEGLVRWEGEDNINRNPGFEDSLFKLSDTSWCVGNGVFSIDINGVSYESPSADYFGHPRPNPIDTCVDIGAIESSYPQVIIDNISEFDLNLPLKFALRQNYPNPFNPSTTIEFTLPKSEIVELKVYNLLGEEVATLVSNKLNQGNHTYTFDGKNLASGIYYYQLVAGDYREVKKMILLR